ncbi:MAG: radical SAM protein [Firmicutes bacterium]|nr:radical SAM protein [Bacillota bacterium]
MDYEGQICRTTMERASYMLPVAVGCAYNKCKFCMLFKHLKYRELPLEQIEQELLRVKQMGGNPQRIFLGDGNAFGLSTGTLLDISGLINKYFDGTHVINMDATVTNIAHKSDTELIKLKDAGVNCLYLGIESGLDDVLKVMKKDHSIDEAYEQIDRLHNSGLNYAAHIMTGVAGRGRGTENAEKTAEFLNRTRPESITNFSMFVHKDAPVFKEIDAGNFEPADELECLREERRLIELLDIDGVLFDGFHDFIEVRIRGTLPRDREKMLAKLDKEIEKYSAMEPVVAYVEESLL